MGDYYYHHSHDQPADRVVASPTRMGDTAAAAAGESAHMPASMTDYRTSIHFLTTPSSASTATNVVAAGGYGGAKDSRGPNSVPVSTLLAPKHDGPPPCDSRTCSGTTYHGSSPATPPVRTLASLPPIHLSADSQSYRDDELTGMAGLMELASPAHPADAPRHPASAGAAGAHTAYFGPPDTHSSSTASSNSAGSLSMAMMGIGSRNSPSTFATPPYASPGHHSNKHPQMAYYSGQQQQQQQQQQSHQPLQALHQQHQQYAQRYAARPAPPALGTGVLTPDSIASMGTRSFPMTVDEMQTSRRRSQSTDSMQTTVFGGAGASALPQVLGNANIRNRSMTATQRQRTSDTPLFPILLHRIINDPQNESWIRWCDNGRAFKFSSADNLLACLQAAGLRAQNYHSIEKNLNDYRFTRLTDQRRKIPDHDGKLWWMFSHPQFLRDSPDGIVNIQRRRRTNPASLAALAPQPSAIPTPAHPPMLHQQHQQHQQQQGYPAHPPGPHSGADGWM